MKYICKNIKCIIHGDPMSKDEVGKSFSNKKDIYGNYILKYLCPMCGQEATLENDYYSVPTRTMYSIPDGKFHYKQKSYG